MDFDRKKFALIDFGLSQYAFDTKDVTSTFTANYSMRKVRVIPHVERAGTRGFRPPEVLVRAREQTTKVDIWAVGVIFLSIISGRYPFFKAKEDMGSLVEMMRMYGDELNKGLERVKRRVELKEVGKVNGKKGKCAKAVKEDKDNKKVDGFVENVFKIKDISDESKKIKYDGDALGLLVGLMKVDPEERMTAEEAMGHVFFDEVRDDK